MFAISFYDLAFSLKTLFQYYGQFVLNCTFFVEESTKTLNNVKNKSLKKVKILKLFNSA